MLPVLLSTNWYLQLNGSHVDLASMSPSSLNYLIVPSSWTKNWVLVSLPVGTISTNIAPRQYDCSLCLKISSSSIMCHRPDLNPRIPSTSGMCIAMKGCLLPHGRYCERSIHWTCKLITPGIYQFTHTTKSELQCHKSMHKPFNINTMSNTYQFSKQVSPVANLVPIETGSAFLNSGSSESFTVWGGKCLPLASVFTEVCHFCWHCFSCIPIEADSNSLPQKWHTLKEEFFV